MADVVSKDTTTVDSTKTGLPKLSASTIWMINFGYLGVQTAFTLQVLK